MYTKAGIVNLCISLVYDALKNGENLEDDDVLDSAKYIMETNTGMTVSIIKERIKEPFTRLNPELVSLDSSDKTIKELSRKWNVSYASMRNFLARNNIDYKRERSDDKAIYALKLELEAFNGNCTLAQMARATKHSYYKVRECVNEYDIPYRSTEC